MPIHETQEPWVGSLDQERSPGERNGNPLQYSCLENRNKQGAWWAAVHRVAKSQSPRVRLSIQTLTHSQERETSEEFFVDSITAKGKKFQSWCGTPGWEGRPHSGWESNTIHTSTVPWESYWNISPWDFSSKNIGVGCHFLLQEFVPTQGSNLYLLCLLYCRQILYPLGHQGKIIKGSSINYRTKGSSIKDACLPYIFQSP